MHKNKYVKVERVVQICNNMFLQFFFLIRMINTFPYRLNKFLYPILLFITNLSIASLMLNYVSINTDINLNATELESEQIKSDKAFAITLDAHETCHFQAAL